MDRRGHGRGARVAPRTAAATLALGIISAPAFRGRRDAIRQTWLAVLPSSAIVKFVVRAGRCAKSTLRDDWLTESDQHQDVLHVYSVSRCEGRWRGAVLSIFAWLQHATYLYPRVTFVGKVDDDAWLDVSGLQVHLRSVATHLEFARQPTFAFLGSMSFTSWVWEGNRSEYDAGFGYRCYEALGAYHGYVQPTLNVSDRSSLGPFPFAAGYLQILSGSLASQLLVSSEFQARVAMMKSSSGRYRSDDKWLGSAVQRHGPASKRLVLVDLGPSGLTNDAYGVHFQSTNVLWHNRVKITTRLQMIHNFSQRFGCSARAHRRREGRSSRIACSVRKGQPGRCSPGSTWCVLSPPCEPHHFELNYSVLPHGREWIQCERASLGITCKPIRAIRLY